MVYTISRFEFWMYLQENFPYRVHQRLRKAVKNSYCRSFKSIAPCIAGLYALFGEVANIRRAVDIQLKVTTNLHYK